MPTLEREPWIPPFIAQLRALLGTESRPAEAGTLAKLRRGLGDHTAERDIWVFGHLRGAAPEHEESAALVASLFALWHQGGLGRGYKSVASFGESYGRL